MRPTAAPQCPARPTQPGAFDSAAAFSVSMSVWLWLLPVWLGLSAAIPLAYVTARRGVGMAALRAGLFQIAGERRHRKDAPLPKGEAVPG